MGTLMKLHAQVNIDEGFISFYESAEELVKHIKPGDFPSLIFLQVTDDEDIRLKTLPHNEAIRMMNLTQEEIEHLLHPIPEEKTALNEMFGKWTSGCVKQNCNIDKLTGCENTAFVGIKCNIKNISTSGMVYLHKCNVDMIYENTIIPLLSCTSVHDLTGLAVVNNAQSSAIRSVSCKAEIKNASNTLISEAKGCCKINADETCGIAVVEYPAEITGDCKIHCLHEEPDR